LVAKLTPFYVSITSFARAEKQMKFRARAEKQTFDPFGTPYSILLALSFESRTPTQFQCFSWWT